VLFVYQGTEADGQSFFERYWPGVRAVADMDKVIYRGFGLQRGNLRQLAGPEVFACGLRATAKGHMIGKTIGDPMQMPGLFLVAGAQILWSHDYAHAADHPDWTALPTKLAAFTAAPAAN